MISVIVPVYNAEKTIEKCVKSIQNQVFTDLEIILVNDGSKDQSLRLCYKMAEEDVRIRVIDSENFGVSHARNLGIQHAKGMYIMFADSDDYVEAEWCANLYNCIQDDDLSWGICNVNCWKNGIRTVENELDFEEKEYSPKNFWEIFKMNLFNQPINKIYRRDIINKFHIAFDEKLPLGEDLLFNLEYLHYISRIIVFNKNLYNYIYGQEDSACNKYYDNFFEMQKKIYTKIKECLTEYNMKQTVSDSEFYESYLGMIYNALENTYLPSGKLSFKERMQKNKAIMDSVEYKECILKTKNIHKKDKVFLILQIRNPFIYEIFHWYVYRMV